MSATQQKFKIETGGDASLLHLASQINRGINKYLRRKEDETGGKWRKIHANFVFIKHLALATYVF